MHIIQSEYVISIIKHELFHIKQRFYKAHILPGFVLKHYKAMCLGLEVEMRIPTQKEVKQDCLIILFTLLGWAIEIVSPLLNCDDFDLGN